jgi:hypothetical protein
VQARVVRQFGVERRTDSVPLPDCHDVPAVATEFLDSFTQPCHNWCPNEHARDWLGQTLKSHRIFEAVNLRPESVAAHRDVEQPERELFSTFDVAREHDHSHASPPNRHPASNSLLDRQAKTKSLHQDSDGRALPAGDHESIDCGERFWSPNFHGLRTHASERLDVLCKIPLNTHDADFHSQSVPRNGELAGLPASIFNENGT